MVLRLVFGREAFLFAGDIEKEAESEIVQSGIEIASPILKVPHHGSLSSSTPQFVARVRPEIAIINVRQRNSFLPSREVLERYEDLGCKILRTDLHGAISIETEGQNLSLHTFLKPLKSLNPPVTRPPFTD